ncbi:bifunctional transcriptional activator/DNA repair enzyme AdaA [Dongia rigui]|uniref:Methylated-DNA--[protein]-cysteine S-methyltransferase n=1 Tax=Dongia rigui TaxID=940149 RepID=A0ABU5DW75_9PROT|nr:methylated-DNA--[protein]-cysteine S-methyltransferase [Dongia rigui]MDY0871559.1 methylated-DNA--[protein]-cysteine S-methyltransferase [Dongia rigui]
MPEGSLMVRAKNQGGDKTDLVKRAAAYIEARQESEADGPITLEELARHCGLSPWHLQRQFKRVMGVSPRDYEESLRLARFKKGLRTGAGVAAATFDAGFGSSSRVYERSGAALGMTPASYARGGKGADIRYALASSALGRILVAATGKGLCRVEMGADDATLVSELHDEFPEADSIVADETALGPYVSEILHRISGRAPRADLPLDIRMTAFQRQVWAALTRIPAGETRTYGEVASAIGQPSAARAVGNTCGRNPVAVAIPCHRVLRNDGAIGGYAWGPERKQALIRAESQSLTTHSGSAGKKRVTG